VVNPKHPLGEMKSSFLSGAEGTVPCSSGQERRP
jgi:hypothetical protein